MSNSQSFDFSPLKKMSVDSLMVKCREYVGQYLSKSAADRLDKAYKSARYDEVKHILEETLKRIKAKINVSEYQKAEKVVLDEFPDAEKSVKFSDKNERRKTDNMGIGSGMTAVVIIIVGVIVIAFACVLIYSKVNNKTVGEVLSLVSNKKDKANKHPKDKATQKNVGNALSHGSDKKQKANNRPEYTDKDRDMMALIHELSIIYDNTDRYLNG